LSKTKLVFLFLEVRKEAITASISNNLNSDTNQIGRDLKLPSSRVKLVYVVTNYVLFCAQLQFIHAVQFNN